ncbi:MAG: hypothetical protein KM296_09265 [Brockia lithotrophica]|nr:hypothetical protein [Brockia lithotrophica]
MRRGYILGVLATLLLLVVAGCRASDRPEDVVGRIAKRAEEAKAYETTGTLTLKTGGEPVAYRVRVAHLKPSYYRVEILGQKDETRQVVLKNEEGVFIFAPELKKTFRFQSRWPGEGGQIYLLESLVESVRADEGRAMEVENGTYVFRVKARAPNRLLSQQVVRFDRETLAPKQVDVLDSEGQTLASFVVEGFSWNPTLSPEDFRREAVEKQFGQSPTSQAGTAAQSAQDLTGVEPTYLPEGVVRKGSQLTYDDGVPTLTVSYGGSRSFTLTVSPARELTVTAQDGVPVDLFFTWGGLTRSDDLRILRFTYRGLDVRLMSTDVPEEELVAVAQSIFLPRK